MLDDLQLRFLAALEETYVKVVERLSDFLSYPFFVSSEDRLYSLYLILFILCGAVAYVVSVRGRQVSWKAIFKYCFPKEIYLTKSTKVDLYFYFVNRIFMKVLYFIGVSNVFILSGESVKNGLEAIWGVPETYLPVDGPAQFFYTVLVVVAADLAFFITHYLSHKVPFLWEFHKVHHSSDSLNPLTNNRFHPVDKIFAGIFIFAFSGSVKGVFAYFTGEFLIGYTLFETGAILFLFRLTANLRHSHIWISYGRVFSHIFISPAQHQIHHSFAERHWDKNFGLVFAFWDHFAGSLYVPKEKEELAWGLTAGEHEEYSSVWRLYVLPFKKVARLWSARGRQPVD